MNSTKKKIAVAGASGRVGRAADRREVAGPREEDLLDLAMLYLARSDDQLRVEEVSDPEDPNRELNETGGLLPGPDAILAGPTFEEWLENAKVS